MRMLIHLLSVLCLLLLPRVARAELRVVATVPTLAAVAEEIGGSHVRVTSLSLATQDPHWVDAKPSLALELNKADLLLLVGLGLEAGWLPTLLTGARNGAIQPGNDGHVDCSRFARLMETDGVADRSKGDIHAGGNPHYYFDPRQIEHVAIGVAAALGRVDAEHRKSYNERLGRFLKKLHQTRQALEKRMKRFRGAPVVTYHKSWVYLSDWLGLKEVGYLEPKPGIPPNPAHVAKVLLAARRQKVKALLQESYYPSATAKLVAEKSGARLVVLPGGVDFDDESYIQHLDRVVKAIEKGLGG